MHKNYYLFKKQIEQLKPILYDAQIISVFTVHKNELIFECVKEEKQYHLVARIAGNNPLLMLRKAKNYKTARFQFFEALNGQAINNLAIRVYNKFIELSTTDFRIHLKFYSAQPNIFLLDTSGEIIEMFKSNFDESLEIPNTLPITLSTGLIDNLRKKSEKMPAEHFIKMLIPPINRKMQRELCYRFKCKGETRIEDLPETAKVYNILQEFKNQLNDDTCFIYRNEQTGAMLLSLVPLLHLEEKEFKPEPFTIVNDALKVFLRESEYQAEYARLLKIIKPALEQRIHNLETALKNIMSESDLHIRKEEADLKGNLILTNKHKIKRQSASVELVNIFSEKSELIFIKLNPKKTAVENAQHYFEKYKNMAEKKQVLQIKKDSYQAEKNELFSILDGLDKASMKELIKIREKLINMHLLQSAEDVKETQETMQFAFRKLIIGGDWDIYIGKNGLNNDLLTFSFANKWDIWLHAQGVPGSHVIIRVKGKETAVPNYIIEQAAQIAAANSKAKHSGTVPVIYTQVRHISRVRKAPPGTVNTKNEKTIFVEPLNINQ